MNDTFEYHKSISTLLDLYHIDLCFSVKEHEPGLSDLRLLATKSGSPAFMRIMKDS